MYTCTRLVTLALSALALTMASPFEHATRAQEAAKGATRVLPGGTTRVYVMAAFDKNCSALPAPSIAITTPPGKGRVTFREGQSITVQQSSAGTCVGQKVAGTGIYYTANDQASGPDTFSITARLSTGETASRTFNLNIQE